MYRKISIMGSAVSVQVLQDMVPLFLLPGKTLFDPQ